MPARLTPDTPSQFEPFGQTGVRQYLFPVLTVFSLTCMVLSAAMWVRSHFIVDEFVTQGDGTAKVYISSIYGRILCAWGDEGRFSAPPGEWLYRQHPIPENITDMWQPSIWKSIGIELRTGEPMPNLFFGQRGGWLRVRWPFIVAMWGILPLLRLIHERHRKRAIDRLQRGQCPECGYDCRYTPHQCPECGTVLVEVRA